MKIAVHQAVEFLSAGKVVAIPTETVYGLAADALNPSAIAKIFEVKKRPADNPLICHFHSMQQVKEFVIEIPETTATLMQYFSPGPISFMLELPENSPLKFATCGSEHVIVRIPDHPLTLEIIKELNHPIAAPSANTSGKVSSTSAEMVEEDLGKKIEGIVDGGISRIGIESTIVDARNENEIFILRTGAIGKAEIQNFFFEARIFSEKISTEQTTPGTKYRHYAPATPVFQIENIESISHERNAVALLTQEHFEKVSSAMKAIFRKQKIQFLFLGSTKDLNELARNFYQNLAALDHLGAEKAFILKTDWGTSSLGGALYDRVSRIIH